MVVYYYVFMVVWRNVFVIYGGNIIRINIFLILFYIFICLLNFVFKKKIFNY